MRPVKNMTFNMELYNMLPVDGPSRQAFYTVSHNQQVFVEVCSALPGLHLSYSALFLLQHLSIRFQEKKKEKVLCLFFVSAFPAFFLTISFSL